MSATQRATWSNSRTAEVPVELRPHKGIMTTAVRQGRSSKKGRLVMKLVREWVSRETSHALCSWMNTCTIHAADKIWQSLSLSNGAVWVQLYILSSACLRKRSACLHTHHHVLHMARILVLCLLGSQNSSSSKKWVEHAMKKAAGQFYLVIVGKDGQSTQGQQW